MMTEVVGGEVGAGMALITGLQTAAPKAAPSSGPRMF